MIYGRNIMTELDKTKISNGKAIAIDTRKILWGSVITVILWLLSNLVLFAFWKGSTDEKIEARPQKYEVQTMIEGKINREIDQLNKKIDKLEIKIDTIILKLK